MLKFTILPFILLSFAQAIQKPNIIFLLTDDQNWQESSVAMHPDLATSKDSFYETPHLEQLASQGMRFSSAYAPSPVCASTRISLQTGRTPAALHWCKAGPSIKGNEGTKLLPAPNRKEILDEKITIAELLKQAGYATAHYGKWHLNNGGPEAHGYDASDGDIGNEQSGKFKGDNPVDLFGMTHRATAFMKENLNKPFFIQMSYLALHSPENASPANLAKFEAKAKESSNNKNTRSIQRAALMADLDTAVGQLVQAIESLNLSQKTYIIYMSDNGGNGRKETGSRKNDSSDLLAGGKGSLGEGGIRSPFIIKGPYIKPNTWNHERIVGYDLFPTFTTMAGISQHALPTNLEGVNLTPLFFNPKAALERKHPVIFHFPHYQVGTPSSAIYEDDYKLIKYYETNTSKLFNITQDIYETKDLSSTQASLSQQLTAKLENQLSTINAQLPTLNPNYDPSKTYVYKAKGGSQGSKTSKKK